MPPRAQSSPQALRVIHRTSQENAEGGAARGPERDVPDENADDSTHAAPIGMPNISQFGFCFT
jgi:hypothetical protein